MFKKIVSTLDKYHPHIMLSCSTIGLGLGVSVGIDDNRFVGRNNPNKYTLADRMITPVCSGLIGLFIGTFIGSVMPILIPVGAVSFIIVKIDEKMYQKNNTTNNNYNDDGDKNEK